MGKSQTFQDLSLLPPGESQELGNWLFTELRKAILDKRLAPGSRMPSRFVVVPERIVDAVAFARTLLDRHPPTLEQAILTDFILDGHFGHHVRRMRQMYARSMAVLCEANCEKLGGGLDVVETDAGMKTLGWIGTGERDAELANRARSRGLEVAALSEFTTLHKQPDALILGFAGCTAAELKRGVGVLAGALERPE